VADIVVGSVVEGGGSPGSVWARQFRSGHGQGGVAPRAVARPGCLSVHPAELGCRSPASRDWPGEAACRSSSTVMSASAGSTWRSCGCLLDGSLDGATSAGVAGSSRWAIRQPPRPSGWPGAPGWFASPGSFTRCDPTCGRSTGWVGVRRPASAIPGRRFGRAARR